MQSNRVARGTFFAAIAALLFAGRAAQADPTVTLSKWLEDIKITGDLRLREEYFDRKTAGQVDRNRQRFRLRLNADFKFNQAWSVKSTFASGTGEQVSTNQSFDNLSSQKDFWIDKIYAVWTPFEWAKVQGGRMENPIWRQYSSDAVWDADFNPEGFSEGVDFLLGPVRVFANGLQMVADEDSGANGPAGQQRDQWMLGEQGGAELRLPLEHRLKFAVANYEWINEDMGTLSQVAVNDGNRRSAGGVLLNSFNVLEYTGELSGWMFSKALSVQGTAIVNHGTKSGIQPELNKGYQVGAIFGKAKEARTWEIAYFNKWLEQDATIADVSDSDFGDGGTNRKGHIYWIAYAPYEWMVIQLKHIDADVISYTQSPSVTPGNRGEDIRRTQFDVSWKF